jgi:hypothetical protein
VINGLISGKLVGLAEIREGKNASKYVIAKVRATGGDGEAIVVNAIAFASEACAALMGLDDGDSVALCGGLTPKVWIDKNGIAKPALDMVVSNVMTVYQAGLKQSLNVSLES